MNIIIRIIILVLFITGVILFVINQKNNLTKWLLYIVIEAEKNLGSKMGQVKLRQAYDEFIFAYPILSKLISFTGFSKMIDNALIEMKELLASNKALRDYVKGEGK